MILAFIILFFYAAFYAAREWYLLKASPEDEARIARLLLLPADFFSKESGWRRKWKNGRKENGEAFPFSSTVLVAFTDFTHLSQFFVNIFLDLFISCVVFVASDNWVLGVYVFWIVRILRSTAIEIVMGNEIFKAAWSWLRWFFGLSAFWTSVLTMGSLFFIIVLYAEKGLGATPIVLVIIAALVSLYHLVRRSYKRIVDRRQKEEDLRG